MNTDETTTHFWGAMDSIFNRTTIIMFLFFLIVYYLLYFLLGKNNGGFATKAFSRSIDMFFLIILVIIITWSYFSLTATAKSDFIGWMLYQTMLFFQDPTTPFSLAISILLFYIIIYICQIPMTYDTKPISIGLIENKLWVLFVIVLIMNFIKYSFNVDLAAIILGGLVSIWYDLPFEQGNAHRRWWHTRDKRGVIRDGSGGLMDVSGTIHEKKEKDLLLKNIPIKKSPDDYIKKPEVFHVSNNIYTYDEAQAVCKSMNARLATYDEVEDAYQQGGEWCSYGWSEGQMGLFPTQKDTWNKLQKTEKHKWDCGRPGINGGYMANPSIKFGINCMGIKPEPKTNDTNIWYANKNDLYPKTKEDLELEEKVNYWKTHHNNMVLYPFNKSKWSEYKG